MLKAKIFAVDENFMVGRGNCAFTGKPYETKKFHKSCLEAYNNGAYVQEAFSDLSAEDREFLISRISPEGWEQEFGELNDETDE